jgi:hypothetical protein
MPSIAAVGDLIIGRLSSIPNLAVFDGKVGVVVKDGDVTRPYAVLYMSPGNLERERLCGRSATRRITGQITVAAGTVDGFRWACGEVVEALTDVRLEPDNRAASMFTFDFDPGPERRDDDDPSDIRWYSPLHFTYTTTRS